jgi:propanediol dehydratase small subunit
MESKVMSENLIRIDFEETEIDLIITIMEVLAPQVKNTSKEALLMIAKELRRRKEDNVISRPSFSRGGEQ